MKNILVFLLFVCINNSILCQKDKNIWYCGKYAGMNFNSGAPVELTNSAMNTLEGCSTVSDTSGQLLFYTNGTTVWNKNHLVMSNGTGLTTVALSEHTVSQTVIVKKPYSSTLYYVFSMEYQGFGGLQYAIVDISLNSGLGGVVSKNNVLVTPTCEKIAAIQHRDGDKFWIVVHLANSSSYRSYLLYSGGVHPTYTTSSVGTFVPFFANSTNEIGYMKSSPSCNNIIPPKFKTAD